MISIIFFWGFSIVSSSGFLLDGSTKSPQAEIGISDSHFTTLMKLFLEERESREQLQNTVLRLQQELTSKVDSVGNCNCKAADITDELQNNTQKLQTELDFLRKDFNALQLQCETHIVDKNITNKLSESITAIKRNMKNNVQYLESGLNDTIFQLDRIKNRAVLTAWVSTGTVAAYTTIPFTRVHTSHGIRDLTSIKNKGEFTCEKPGLYLISVYVTTNSNSNVSYYVYKNNEPIILAARHPQSYVITFTAIVTERLQTNDTVYVHNYQQMFVYGSYQSTFSIIQIG